MNWIIRTPGVRSSLLHRGEDTLSTLHQEINRVFDDIWQAVPAATGSANQSTMSLRLDVQENEKSYHVTADLPGLNESDVDVTFADGTLTIRGQKKVERDDKQGTWHITERSHGSFSRQVNLPHAVDADKIEAKFEKGVLTVNLPKLAEVADKTRKIAIKTS